MMETNTVESNTPILRAENISRLSTFNKTPKKIISEFSYTFQNERIYNIYSIVSMKSPAAGYYIKTGN
jgi:hypothetical protein